MGQPKIFYKDGQWFGYFKPKYVDDMYHVENMLNERAVKEAKDNALPILNPEICPQNMSQVEIGKNYDWPGTMEKTKFPFLHVGWKECYKLTPPSKDQPKNEEQDAAHSLYRIEYDNDTGPRDESFYEWWTVIEIKTDEQVCKCDKEQGAIDIVASLTELTRLRSELQQKDEVIKLLEEYVSLLGKGLSDSASFLDAHGWSYSQHDIEKGIELRSKIESLKKQS